MELSPDIKRLLAESYLDVLILRSYIRHFPTDSDDEKQNDSARNMKISCKNIIENLGSIFDIKTLEQKEETT